jgi:sugar lactone lactonase YvrE
MGRVLLTVLLLTPGSGCIPDLDRTPSDLGADADSRPWLPEPGADLPKGDVSIKDQGGDRKLCSTDAECDDGITCTDDKCLGSCQTTIQAGYCLIAGTCVTAGTADPSNPCATCAPTSSNTDWTTKGACVSTLAGNGKAGKTDGPAGSAQFFHPTDVAVDGAGAVYVADRTSHRIRQVSGGQVSTLAGSSAGLIDGAYAQARFNQPSGIWLGAPGQVFVADRANNRVRLLSGGQVSTFDTGAGLVGPGGGATVSSGETFVADTFHHRIAKIPAGGTTVTNVAGKLNVADHKDGAAGDARFFYPTALAIDGAGTVYVADTFNHCIRVIKSGQVGTFAGVPNSLGKDDGAAASARFFKPRGVAVDAQGTVYVSDTENHRVRMVKGGQVTTIAGGSPGFKDGAASAARFDWPWGLTVDAKGTIYVADSENHRVRVVVP